MDPELIYLDNAATTFPKPPGVLEAMMARYRQIGVSPGRGSYDRAAEAEGVLHQAREKLARFFGAPDPDRVIFTANATDSLNLVLSGLLQPGDHVVTTRLEHNSVLRPLHHLQQRLGISCSLVPFSGEGFIDPDDVAAAIRPETRLVVVNHASNVLGTVQPVGDVGGICAARRIALLVDASQSAGKVPVDMAAMKAYAVAFTGHKSLYGPTGIGGLVLHPELEIAPTRFGGTGIESSSRVHTPRYPHRLEAGTHNLMGIIGLILGMDYLMGRGLAAVHGRETVLTERLRAGLSEIRGVELYGPTAASNRVAVLSVNIQGAAPEDVGAILDGDFNIAVRVGLHCAPLVHEALGTARRGAVRFSLGCFNTEADIDRAVAAMALIAGQHS